MDDLTFDGLIYATLPPANILSHPTLGETTIVLRSRQQLEGHFPWPQTLIANAEYALTEAGEYLDALLRIRRTTDKRNRNKDHDPIKELGQCGYMIASGLLRTGIPAESTIALSQILPAQGHMQAYGSLVNGLANTIKASYPPDESETKATHHLLIAWGCWCFLARWHRNTTAAELLLGAAKGFEDKHIK
ncbi:MAG: hypothetical protein U0X20_17070 [Caldilineaceae bacterium]